MARFADGLGGLGPNPYDDLLAREEAAYTRHGGRLVLVGADRVARQLKPSPRLAQLRAGEPVEVPDWMVPSWARPSGNPVRNVMLRVHPSGWVEELP